MSCAPDDKDACADDSLIATKSGAADSGTFGVLKVTTRQSTEKKNCWKS